MSQTNKPSKSSLAPIEDFLEFTLHDKHFGIEMQFVHNVIRTSQIKKAPAFHAMSKGLINIQQGLIPILDITSVFNLPELTIHETSKVIVISIHKKTVGILADKVGYVTKVPKESIQPIPLEKHPELENITMGNFVSGDHAILLLKMPAVLPESLLDNIPH